jgi:hypothetical protein
MVRILLDNEMYDRCHVRIVCVVSQLIACHLFHAGFLLSLFFDPEYGSDRPYHTQAVSRWLPTAAVRVRARAEHVRFVVDKVSLGQVFSEYFGFPCQS